MKKKRLSLGLFLILATIITKAQVGINTSTPAITLDVVGKPTVTTSLDGVLPPRLTGDELGQKTYTGLQKGALVYVTAGKTTSTNTQVVYVNGPGLYQFDGTFWLLTVGKLNLLYGTLGTGVTGPVNSNQYTGASITLPPGKWLVNVQMIVKMVTNPTSGISYWVRSSFSNSSTAFSISPDIVGSTFISAPIVGLSQYAMMNGAIRINNTSSTAKTYYYWKEGGGLSFGGGSSNIDRFASTDWGENIIYGIPYVD